MVAESGLWARLRAGEWCAALLAAMLVFAPLIRAGNRPIPLLVLELLSLLLLLSAWDQRRWRDLPRPLRWGILGMLLLPLLYWLPVPWEWWGRLPGREPYAAALAQLEAGGGWRALSLWVGGTEQAFLALLPPLAVFLAVVRLEAEVLRRVVGLVLLMGVVQALLGLLQFGTGADSPFSLGNPYAGGGAHGFHANRDHFAAMMEMLLPLALALTAARVGHGQRPPGFFRSWRHRFSHWVDWRANQTLLYAACATALFLGLIFSRSRAGVALAMLLIVLAALLFARRLGGKRAAGLTGTLAVAGLALAAEIGLAPVLQRFVLQDPLQDARWAIYEGAMNAIARFAPLGSGPGTFTEVYPAFQTAGMSGYVNHAHNDYLEWLFEGGVPALLVLGLLTVAYLMRWRAVWHAGDWRTFRFIQVGAGLGLLMAALHSVVDFGLHIPANAIYFALLAGLFFHRGEAERKVPDAPKRRMPAKTEVMPARQILGPALEPVPNPLED